VTSSFDNMIAMFRESGMTPEAARIAAIGRGFRNEAEAREHWDRSDRLMEAERAASAAMLAPTGQAPALEPETLQVVEAARAKLGMGQADARVYAVRLQERETRRAGSAHAKRFLQEFARGLVSGSAT
jgi:hypothetical protein